MMKKLVMIMIACGLVSQSLGRPLIIAHRGASRECPENTLASVKRAWEIGADAVEIDVFSSADGRAIVIHDANTSRTTGKDFLVTASAASVLRQLDAGKWKGDQFAGEKLPYLEEVLATLPPGKKLFIELKGDVSTAAAVVNVLRQHDVTTGIVAISFSLETLSAFKKQLPHVPCYWLRSTIFDLKTQKPMPHVVSWLDQVSAAGLQGIDVHDAGLTQSFVQAAHKRGLEVYVWTVNAPTAAQKLAAMGVDGITTDDPRELIRLRSETSR
ncbi:MAG: glycerophosphodiester phosphodiesterase [Candidatus Sumerlaeaceae bacterium]